MYIYIELYIYFIYILNIYTPVFFFFLIIHIESYIYYIYIPHIYIFFIVNSF